MAKVPYFKWSGDWHRLRPTGKCRIERGGPADLSEKYVQHRGRFFIKSWVHEERIEWFDEVEVEEFTVDEIKPNEEK